MFSAFQIILTNFHNSMSTDLINFNKLPRVTLLNYSLPVQILYIFLTIFIILITVNYLVRLIR